VATQSIESMTDLRQLVISHCQQHPPRIHPDITSQAIAQHHPAQQQQQQLQPLLASGFVSSNLAANITRLPSPTPFLLRAPPLHPKVNRFILLIHRTIHP
jgi:neuroligin